MSDGPSSSGWTWTGAPARLLVFGPDRLARTPADPLRRDRHYGELAERLGRGDQVRAVAGSIARALIPIVISCHRVLGADAPLTGYLGSLQHKRAPLALTAEGDGLAEVDNAGTAGAVLEGAR